MKSSKFIFPLIAVFAFIALTVSSCKEKEGCTDPRATNYDADAEKDNGSCTCIAGLGGDITLVVTLQHHGNNITSTTAHPDTVYLKYNSANNPGADLSLYDTYFVGHDGEDHIHLENLTCGQYYIYGTGFDASASERVAGGIPYTLSDTSGEVHINVPVTEDH
jgi:hypothetical protein